MKKLSPALFIMLLLLSLTTLVLSGCGGEAAPPAVAAESTTLSLPATVDATTTNQLRQREDVVILDVREDWEFASGHVPGATWIPLGQLSNRLDEIPADKTVVAVCRSGNRSGQATQLLQQQGFDAHNMAGGMISWEQAGLPVER